MAAGHVRDDEVLFQKDVEEVPLCRSIAADLFLTAIATLS